MKVSIRFSSAREDYEYLLNRGYPAKSALDLVGNHAQLSKAERMLLFRGIRPETACARTHERLLPLPFQSPMGFELEDTAICNEPTSLYPLLIIDGYNVLFTIMSYLSGDFVFIANDGLVRDISGIHGHIKNETLLKKSIKALVETLGNFFKVWKLEIFLDSPVSKSAEHKTALGEAIDAVCEEVCIKILQSADSGLVGAQEGILCTSDSVIIDRTVLPILDIAHCTLRYVYNADIPFILDLH